MVTTLLANTGFQIPVSPILLFALFALLLIVWAGFSWIIRYHWKNYGTGKLEVLTMTFFYLGGSLVLLGLTALSAFLYYASASL